jgi:hypothetical protein
MDSVSFFLEREPREILESEMPVDFLAPAAGALLLETSYLGGSLFAAQMLFTSALTLSSKLAPDLAGATPRPSRSGLM